MSRAKDEDPRRAVTRTLVRIVMELVEAHYRGQDTKEHRKAFQRKLRALPRNITPSDIEALGGGGRELATVIAAGAAAEARKFTPKKSWLSPLGRKAAEMQTSKHVGLSELLFEEWSRTAKEKGHTPPTRDEVAEYVAEHLGRITLQPDSVARAGRRSRARGQ